MFEKRYKEDFDRIQMSDTANGRILEAIRQEEARKTATPSAKRRAWPSVVAAVACVALFIGAIWAVGSLYPNLTPVVQSNRTELPVTTPAAVTTYGDVFLLVNALQAQNANRNDGFVNLGDSEEVLTDEDAAVPEAPLPPGSASDTKDDAEFTGTNTQYADVDEADVIKTDGEYIYILSNQKKDLAIVKADGKNTAAIGRIDLIDKAEYINMYYVDDRLVVLYTDGMRWSSFYGDSEMSDCVALSYTCVTRAAVYDVSDRTAPRLLTTLGQDGALVDSRMVDGVLYLVTNHGILSDAKEEDKNSYIPSLYRDDISAPVAESCLCIAPEPDRTDYAIVTAVQVTDEVARVSEKAVFGSGSGIVYANTEHLLLATPHYEWTNTKTPLGNNKIQYEYEHSYSTALTLFSIAEGQVTLLADRVIEGSLDGQFAIDEYDGYFRLAATRSHSWSREILYQNIWGEASWIDSDSKREEDNALYVLDGTLKEVGRVEDLAPDEQVKSVRFEGEIGYVVTFRQTDPLFAIDLSDPTAPKVLSALKITGFSEYLHPWSDNRLLGFGHAGTEEGINGQLKLTMFNTENKADVTVQTALEIAVDYSEALYDHHAILVDADRGVVGFPVGKPFVNNYELYAVDGYQLYAYDEETGFSLVAECALGMEKGKAATRGMFIGDYFYICHENGVSVYDTAYTELVKIDF